MKKIAIIVIGILAVLFIISAFKDMIIEISIEKGVEFVTGLKLNIGHLNVGITKGVVHIRDLKIFNPADFKDRVMVDMPEIFVNCDLLAAIGGKIHIRQMRINLREMTVVKNEDGKLNINSFKVVMARKEGKRPGAEEKPLPEIQIDELRLTVGRAAYKDYSQGPTPQVQEFNVNIDERYTNITDPYTLVSLIIVKTLMNTTISNLANFDINRLSGTVGDMLSRAQTLTTRATSVAKETIQTTVRQTQGVARTAEEAASQTVKSLEEIFKSAFGGK